MSRYTTDLRTLVSMYGAEYVTSWFTDYNLEDYLTTEEINVIKKRNTWNKERLANKIVNHYLMKEIGFETPALFAHFARTTMAELMEEYAPLIYSASIEYDPLVNVDFTETFHQDESGTANNKGTSNSNSSSKGTGLTINSDTPQGQINKEEILNGNYASSTNGTETDNIVNDVSTSNSDTTTAGKTDYTKTTRGNSGVTASAQKMIEQYRDNIRAIDHEIIDKLSNLFMGIY